MAKHANSGELRTPIIVERYTEKVNNEGKITSRAWENVFGPGELYRVKWVNVHGTEVYEAMRLDINEPATLTGRFSERITPQCRVMLASDANNPDKETLCYEIISIDNVENRNEWLEIKVKRKVNAR